MSVDVLDLLVDLHASAYRQGPGDDSQTRLALKLTGLRPSTDLKIADIGCGTGAAALILAADLQAKVTAVDLLDPFLGRLAERATLAGLEDRIKPLKASMTELPFLPESFDAIWSEGAIYNMGFAEGLDAWRRFLKPGGRLVVSDLTWLTATRPAELQDYWDALYPGADTAAARFALLEQAGFRPTGYFTLPSYCWLDNYYRPTQAKIPALFEKHGTAEPIRAFVKEFEREVEIYETYRAHVSYGVYIAEKV